MPKIFRTKDIEQMKASDVSREFVDYYNRLSDERKKDFAESRPDLYSAVLAWNATEETQEKKETEELLKIPAVSDEKTVEDQPVIADKEHDKDYEAIKVNVYKGISIPKLVKDNFRPVEALTIDDKQTKCPAHRITLSEYNPKFHKSDGTGVGMMFYHCPKCNRLFIKRSRFEPDKKYLDEWGVPYRFYDYDISQKYLKTQIQPYELALSEKIYVPNLWIEENPKCPLHEIPLEELPCLIHYKNKTVSFDAYYCNDCQKIILRRTSARKMEDQCAKIGIPLIEFIPLVKKSPSKQAVPRREIKPDYYMDEGIRSIYSFDHIADCFQLSEMDTVVVSDSIYCTLEGHNTDTVLGLIWVKERYKGERKSYLFKLGYCADCQKYYIDEVDYNAIYKIGRPEVTILVDRDDNSYMITSGEVFEIERSHLESVEYTISHEVSEIQRKPDYLSQFATLSYYDDGNIAYRKAESKKKYEGLLSVLFGYQSRPYEYRVDISSSGRTETYYVGSSDININNGHQVISANSKLGRELVHYQTVKVQKDGHEYDIKLSRQFDISEASLYGYTNLRTDEDIIFRRGITDPFLVRVLNLRKKQHNLIDIFVTIQENQNSIVDARFDQNLVVQGCAGSGKTMVMLHRLSSLKYNRPDFDFSRDALILTPNDDFSLHIKGLAESLQIGNISRTSVEQYYAGLLGEYSKELIPTGSISSEMAVTQKFVDYVYSDDFKRSFEKNYSVIIDKRNELAIELQIIAEFMGEELRYIDVSNDSNVLSQLKNEAAVLSSIVNTNEKKFNDSAQSLRDLKEEKERLYTLLPEKRENAVISLKDASLRAKEKALAVLYEKHKKIDKQKEEIVRLDSERTELEAILESLGKNDELPLSEYVDMFSDLTDEGISEKMKIISVLHSEINERREVLDHMEQILSVPLDQVIASGKSEDEEISRFLIMISDNNKRMEQLVEEKSRTENGWVFRRARKLERINNQIEEIIRNNETYKSDIRAMLDERRDTYEKEIKTLEKLNSNLEEKSNGVKEEIKQKQRKRLGTINSQIASMSYSTENDVTNLAGHMNIVVGLSDEMDENDIVNWFHSVSTFIPEVKEELGQYDRLKKEIAQYEEDYSGIDDKILSAQALYDTALSRRFSEEIKESLRDLWERINAYSVLGTYQMTFDASVQSFKENNNIKTISGKYHRYDLYAQLLFAMKYYGKAVGKTRFLCVDEAQDLAMNEYRLIYELNSGNVVFNLFGDTNQLIKANRGISDWEIIKTTFRADMFSLNENYRNTNQITRFCNDSFDMHMLQTGVDGAKVREITGNEFDDEVSNLHVTTERVAVLLPRGIQKKKYINRDGIKSGSQTSIGEEIGSGKIAVMYVDEVKGIEFDKVYVVPNKMGRNEKYIAYTRALSELIVVIDENSSSISDGKD